MELAEEAKYRSMCFSYLFDGWQDSAIQKIYQWLFADTWFNDKEKWVIVSKVREKNTWVTEKFFWTAKKDTIIFIPTILDPGHVVDPKIVCMGPSINEDLKTLIRDICQMIGVNADDWTIEAIVEVFNRQTWDRIASDYSTIWYHIGDELSKTMSRDFLSWMDTEGRRHHNHTQTWIPDRATYQQILQNIDPQIAKKYEDNYIRALKREIKNIFYTLYTDLYTAYLQDRDGKEIKQNIVELKKQYPSYKPGPETLSLSLSKSWLAFLYNEDLRKYVERANSTYKELEALINKKAMEINIPKLAKKLKIHRSDAEELIKALVKTALEQAKIKIRNTKM